MDTKYIANALGRRKCAVARVYVKEGNGKITINKRDLTEYFPSTILQFVVKQPLALLDVLEKYDINVNLYGGGYTGQSQALRLAIARALVKINAEDKKTLRAEGFMTRDSREVERKKPGRPKARRRFQFSKRCFHLQFTDLQYTIYLQFDDFIIYKDKSKSPNNK
jgi:small subunit ribosomal protein S9